MVPLSTVGFVGVSTFSLLSNLSNISCNKSLNPNSVRRPAGTTMIFKRDEMRLIAANNKIAEKYHTLKEAATVTIELSEDKSIETALLLIL